MSDKTKSFDFVLLVVVVSLIAALLGGIIGYNKGKLSCPECPKVETDTITSINSTITGGTADRPDADSLISVDSKPVPVPLPVYLPGDTVFQHDTVEFYLPYEHRLFSLPDTFDVWYSGIDPRIDSTRVYLRSTTITVDHFPDVRKMPRLTANLGAGALYIDKGIYPYLIGEIRYNSTKTTFAAFGAIDHNGRWGAGLNVTYRINLIK